MNEFNTITRHKSSRRAFLRDGALLLATAATTTGAFAAPPRAPEPGIDRTAKPLLRIGVVTDLHYADKPPGGSRFYRRSIERLEAAVEQFNKDGVDIIVELGDLVDAAASVDTELTYLRTINAVFAAAKAPRHYVLGNHCVDTLTKDEFLGGVRQEKSYYSFDVREHHIVILDACSRADNKSYGRRNFKWDDSNVPPEEVEWLAADLAGTKKPAVVFMHQRLDTKPPYSAKNADAVRAVLEKAGNVRAAFHGHEHKNDHRRLGGIDYTTLAALVENGEKGSNAYAVIDFLPHGDIAIKGYARQASYESVG